METMKWQDPTVESYFSRNQTTNKAAISPPPVKPSSTNKGAIAGGVVGGIACLLVLTLLVYLLYRRKQRGRSPKENIGRPFFGRWTQQVSEMESNDIKPELHGRRMDTEVAEKDGMSVSEMGAGIVAVPGLHQLEGTTLHK